MSATEYKKLTSLFDILPLDEKGIKIFTDSFKSDDKNERLNLTIENYLFLKENNDKQTFIETLVKMDEPKTDEEMKIRLYLMSQFFSNRNNLSAISKEERYNILNEQYTKFIDGEYNNMFKNFGITPKFTLDEYCEQIKQVIIAEKDSQKINEGISPILDTYFKDMESIPYEEKNIGFVALTNKVRNSKLFDFHYPASQFMHLSRNKFKWLKNEDEFFISTITGACLFVENNLKMEKNKVGLTEELMFHILQEVISDNVSAEKIIGKYNEVSSTPKPKYKN
jgi:hypothetical protein